MNNIKKYIKNIWTIMPMHTKKEKFYLNELKKHPNLYNELCKNPKRTVEKISKKI